MFPRANRFLAFAPFFLALAVTSSAQAEKSTFSPETGYHYGEVEDARYLALGGALRARGNGTTSVFMNPAGIGMARVYHIGGLAQIWPEAKRQSYGAAAVDSVTSRLGAGVGFVWNDQDPDGLKRRSQDLRFALAYPFSDKVSFGITGRYLKLTQEGLGPLGRSLASGGLKGEPIVNGFSFDAGLAVAPSKNITLGFLGSNLSNPGNGFQPTSLGGGIAIGNDDLAFEGDVVADFTTWGGTRARAMGGFEILAADRFPLRAGYLYDAGPQAHAISGGLGYIDTQFSLEISARRYVVGEQATTIVLGLQYFIESTGLTRPPDSDF